MYAFAINSHQLQFETKSGIFSRFGLDVGSKLLLETVKDTPANTILDLGGGCGVLGITLAKLNPHSKVYIVDSDIRAVRLSEQNARLNEVHNIKAIVSDGVDDLPADLQFDLIVSNPPTHQSTEVLIQFIQGAFVKLASKGHAFFVVNRMQSVMTKMQEIFGNCEKVIRQQGYIVFKSTCSV